MRQEELNEILRLHVLWIAGDTAGAYADLRGADLRYTNLSNTNLSYANLSYTNLSNTNLSYADLSRTHLSHANLSNTNLCGANLSHANLSHANLDGVVYNCFTAFFALQCPDEGSFIGYKKLAQGCIAKLLIPASAKRSSATSRKCRAEFVYVLDIITPCGVHIPYQRSRKDSSMYTVGTMYYPDGFCDDRWEECAQGVHFFITRKEAEDY